MNREFLKGLGLSDEDIEKIMSAHGKTINDLNQNIETLTTERDELQGQVETNANDLAELKKDADKVPELKEKIEKMETTQAEAATESATKIAEVKKGYEVKLALAAAGARNDKAVKALIDLEKVSLDASGKVIGLSEQLEALKEDEGTKFLFHEQTDPNEQQQEQKKKKITFGDNSNGSNGGKEVDPFEAAMKEFE